MQRLSDIRPYPSCQWIRLTVSDPIGAHQDTNAASRSPTATKEENARKPMRTATRLKWSADHWSETYRALVRSSRRRSSSEDHVTRPTFFAPRAARNQSGATSLARRSAERSVRRAAGSRDLQRRKGRKEMSRTWWKVHVLVWGRSGAECGAEQPVSQAAHAAHAAHATAATAAISTRAALGRAGQSWAALGRAGRVDPPRHPRRPARPLSPSSVPHFVAPAIGQVGGPPLDALRSTRCALRTMR